MSFLFDGLLAALLATTIVYAAILNRKLRALRKGEAEMKALLTEFNVSAAKAEANLGQIKAIAGQVQSGRGVVGARDGASDLAALKQQLDRGQALKDDLKFVIERGEAIADRLVDLVSEARAATRPGAAASVDLSAVPLPSPASPAAAKARKPGAASSAERELLKALRAARPDR